MPSSFFATVEVTASGGRTPSVPVGVTFATHTIEPFIHKPLQFTAWGLEGPML